MIGPHQPTARKDSHYMAVHDDERLHEKWPGKAAGPEKKLNKPTRPSAATKRCLQASKSTDEAEDVDVHCQNKVESDTDLPTCRGTLEGDSQPSSVAIQEQPWSQIGAPSGSPSTTRRGTIHTQPISSASRYLPMQSSEFADMRHAESLKSRKHSRRRCSRVWRQRTPQRHHPCKGGIRGYAYEAHPREAFDACAKTPFNTFAYLRFISEYLKIIAMAKQAADFYITSCDEGDAYLATKARSLERARTDFLIIVSNI
ncbi:hypothetical protein MY4038_008298 [Beauveria bassiana]